jgi:hypothetical protein
MRMVSLATNHSSFFIRCHRDTAAFAPDLKFSLRAFRFCHFHFFSRFHLPYPVASENARRSRPCNPPDACNCPTDRSKPVSRPIAVGVFPLLRCGRERTKWASCTSCSERLDTIACRLWAIERYSTNLIPALFRTSAGRRFPVVLMLFAIPESAFGYAAWLYADDQNANDCHFLSTSCSPSVFTRTKCEIVKHV